MHKDVIITASCLKVRISPVGFQHYANDFYDAYRSLTPALLDTFSLARLFLICRTIELAGKALHLHQGLGSEDIRKIGHDLEAACEAKVLEEYGINLDSGEVAELKRANDYYERKGFEYYLFSARDENGDTSGIVRSMRGWPNLPGIEVLENNARNLLSANLEL